MPLVSGSSPGAFKQNVRTLMGEIGKSPHVQSRAQALAIAYSKQRQGRQAGGAVGGLPPDSMLGYLLAQGRAAGGTVLPGAMLAAGGVVDHDADPDLPRAQDDVQMIDHLRLPPGYEDPAYLATIRRLLLQQHLLNRMQPQEREELRRYWLGGYLGG